MASDPLDELFDDEFDDDELDDEFGGYARAEEYDDPGLAPMIACGERDLAALVAAGEIHQCIGCGCTELTPCPGGCIWATPNLCSRCA